MSTTVRKAGLACLLGMLMILICAPQVSAQETGTLIVYEEAQGGDATFSFSATGSLTSFQIATESGGGAKVFDLPPGTYTITQNNITDWAPTDLFADGTGNYTINPTQNKATITITSSADVFYVRFTNQNQNVIPEIPTLPILLAIIIATSITAVAVIKKHKKTAPLVFGVLLSVCILLASLGTAMANPDKYIQLGTIGNDEQTRFGTPNKDVIIQLGFGGADIQYAEGAANDDVIIQNGGSGNDDLTEMNGDGVGHIIQEGGNGTNTIFTGFVGSWQTSTSVYFCNGGSGIDDINLEGGDGNLNATILGGDGNDLIQSSLGSKDDVVRIDAGAGKDIITYDLSAGRDVVLINGGNDEDSLTINENHNSLQLFNDSGIVMFTSGQNGSTITIISIEHGQVFGDDGKVAFQW
jgi:hypothetical protein